MVQTVNRVEPVSSVALVLKQLIDGIKIDHPKIKTVYDETVSFDSALKKFRGDQDKEGTAEPFLPAFIFNREPLQYSEGLGLRNKFAQTCIIDGDVASIFKFVVGYFNVDFQIVFRSVREWERMEALYLAGEGFTSNRLLKVCFPDNIGEYYYQVEFEPLLDKIVNYESAIYKSLTGRAKIEGTYLFFKGTAPLIKEVQISVENFQKAVFMDITCPVG